jgi:hypothetical protein
MTVVVTNQGCSKKQEREKRSKSSATKRNRQKFRSRQGVGDENRLDKHRRTTREAREQATGRQDE